jgi:hypothetical protein
MDVYEALAACTPDAQGLRAAVTYPGRAYLAIDFGGEPQPILVICIADENSKGETIPGGCFIVPEESDDYKYINGFSWRPAVKQGRDT